MRCLFLLIAISIFGLYSCNKKEDINQTFFGYLPIVSTNTPSSVSAGEVIVSHVRCELTSISGSVTFKGFTITKTAPHEFSLSAKAFYEDWNTQVSLPMMWTLDTTASIATTTAGRYILSFYNKTQLFKSDTVQVN